VVPSLLPRRSCGFESRKGRTPGSPPYDRL